MEVYDLEVLNTQNENIAVDDDASFWESNSNSDSDSDLLKSSTSILQEEEEEVEESLQCNRK